LTATPTYPARLVQGKPAAEQLPMRVVRGYDAVCSLQSLVGEIARQSGQGSDGMDLAYFLSMPKSRKKTPYLVLSRAASPSPDEPCVDGYRGAVLLYEYRYAGVGTRVFASSDAIGRRNVFAPLAARAALAANAAQTLVERGAHLVHLAYLVSDGRKDEPQGFLCNVNDVAESAGTSEKAFYPASAVEATEAALHRMAAATGSWSWNLLEGRVPLYLPLESTFDRTVARFGKKTRTNLRYYPRLAEREQGCTFVPEVQMNLAEFVAFNRQCGYAEAVPDSWATWRWHSLAEVANPVFCGVRDGLGRWACLIGGRRNGTEMEMDWQMNRTDLSRYSLSTAARSWLIDHEVERGTQQFSLEGGSSHVMMRSFVQGRVAKLTVKRDSVYTRLLTRFASQILPGNPVGLILSDAAVPWRAR